MSFRIDLRPQVARDIGVRDLDAVDRPGGLGGRRGHAVDRARHRLLVRKSVIIARLLLRSAPGARAMSSRLTTVVGVAVSTTKACRRCGNGQSVQAGCLDQLHMRDRRGARCHGQRLRRRRELRGDEAQDIVAERHRHEGEFALRIRRRGQDPFGRGGFELHLDFCQRPVLPDRARPPARCPHRRRTRAPFPATLPLRAAPLAVFSVSKKSWTSPRSQLICARASCEDARDRSYQFKRVREVREVGESAPDALLKRQPRKRLS